MPKNMSFALTISQIQNQTKHVTRRKNWWIDCRGKQLIKEGNIIRPVTKVMGFRKGEKMQMIGDVMLKVVKVTREPLSSITLIECLREGFPEMSPDDFIEMYIQANGGDANQLCTRIEFDYLPF